MARRVVVTGAGVISAIATGREEFWDALEAMRSGAKLVELERFGTIGAFPAPPDDGAEERFGRKSARRMDRTGRLGAVAAALALEDAGDLGVGARADRLRDRLGPRRCRARSTRRTRRSSSAAPTGCRAFAVPLGLPNTAASAVAREHRLHGPSTSIGTACAAGSDAIGAAFRLIRDGHADAMVAGGADAALTPFLIAGYRSSARCRPALGDPTKLSRPFDRGATGS